MAMVIIAIEEVTKGNPPS